MSLLQGMVEPGFESVAQEFAANLERQDDVGAACCVYVGGQTVVDLWGGIADVATQRPWQQDTLQLVFSVAKGVTTACILRLAQAGKLDLDLPVATYWPEFAANGKQGITTRMVLAHRAGLAAVDGTLSLAEVLAWEPVVNAIAAQAPNWAPGSGHGYHARSFGWILGEILRRIDGRSLGNYLREEIGQPLGLDLWIGLPERELPRCAAIIPVAGNARRLRDALGADALTVRVLTGPCGLFDYNEMWNTPPLLCAEIPSSNLVTDARSLAKFYAALIGEVDGLRLLRSDTLAQACTVQSSGPDKVLGRDTTFGLGFSLPPFLPPPIGPRSFGHLGAGGAAGFADPECGIAFGYVMNRLRFDPEGDRRSERLVRAVYEAVGAGPLYRPLILP